MEIQLTSPDSYDIAVAILNNQLPPSTNNMEVVYHLAMLAKERNLSISFYRLDGNRKVIFNIEEVLIACNENIEIRP